MFNRFVTNKARITKLVFLVSALFVVNNFAAAQFNPEINYQGKLTDTTGMAVTDGTYNMNFWLVPTSGGATSTAVWSEARTGANRVQVTNGLFSVMLGDVSSLAGVDFNQTLYLAVEIGGTGTPTWDGELLPRKILGAVPAAFVAETANSADALSGIASSSFLRSDEVDTMTASSSSSLLTLVQNGVGKVLSLFSGATEIFTALSNGNIGIGTTTPSQRLSVGATTGSQFLVSSTGVVSDGTWNADAIGATYGGTGLTTVNQNQLLIGGAGNTWSQVATSSLGLYGVAADSITSAQLLSSVTNETGTGALVFGTSPTFTTQITSPLVVGGTAAGSNLSLKSTSGVGTTDYIRFLVGNNGGTEAMRVTNDGYLGIGTPTPSSLLDVGGFSTTNYTMKTGTLGLQSYSLNNGLLGENSYYVNGDGWKRMATGYASSIHLFQGQTMFNTANTGTGDFTQTLPLKATWSNSGSVALGGNIDVYPTNFTGASMVVLGTGNVGIGTTTPSQRLSVGATTGSQFLVSSAGVVTDGTWNADVIGGAYGGTGLSSVTQNQLLIGGAGNTWSQVATSSLGLSASFSTSAQLASLLSDEVGTGGGFVRASSTMLTSPTLITPALGTPSSGVLTNATGLPVSTGIAGLGTGVATFLATPSSANLISAVTDETGTGALVFANSPTLTGTLSGANATFSGTLGVSGTSTLATTTASTLTIAGALRDSSASAGTAGMVLQSTGTSTRWVATSTLGFTSGATTFLGLTDTPSSFTANRIIFTNSGATALTDSADLTYDGTNLGLGSGDGISFNGVRYFTASSTQYSLSLGHGAGSGGNSVTVGYFTGSSNTGVNLVALGQSAAQNNTGIHLNAIGRNAGTNNSGQYSNLFGESAGYSNAGDNVIAIGNEAMGSTTAGNTGSNNIALGYRSLFNARSGGNNIALGYRAADNLTTGANNIVIGYDLDAPSATNNNQLNIGNLIFGTGLDGTGTTLSTGNIGIGTTTPGSKLTVAGDLRLTGAFRDSTNASGTAGMVLQTTGSGTQWVATSSLGFTSGASTFLALTDTPSSYTANRIMYTNSGATALTDSADFTYDGTNLGLGGDDGIAFGSTRFFTASTTGNVAIGQSAGLTTSGNANVIAIGYEAARNTSFASNNVAIGYRAGRDAVTASSNNVFIGQHAGATSTGSANIILGQGAGSTQSGSDNNILGRIAGTNSRGDYNNLFGYGAGANQVGTFNNLFGYQAGAISSGTSSNLIGNFAGYDQSGSSTNLIGSGAGVFNSGDYVDAIGAYAGYSNTGDYNSILGYYAGEENNGSNNNLFGYQAGRYNEGTDNNIIGREAGNVNSGSNNNIIGLSAGYWNNGNDNQFIGTDAGRYVQGASSVFIGASAFSGVGTAPFSATNNTVIGFEAGKNATTSASNNILLGYRAADNITTGAGNIVIGYDIDLANSANSNTLNIGNLVFGTGVDGTGTTLSSGNVGIGTSTPGSKLTIAGDIFATGAFRDSSNASGTLGMVLQSTGTSTRWVATSTLGITGGGGSSLFTDAGATTYLTATGDNLGIGTTTAGSRLTVDGDINLTGAIKFNNQSAIKYQSGNVVFGEYALPTSNSNIYSNTVLGDLSGNNLVSGSTNVFVGFYTGRSLSTSTNNVVIGTEAVGERDGGTEIGGSVIIGRRAGYNLEGNYYHTFIGDAAGENVTTGGENTLIGNQAGSSITTGDGNIVLGSWSTTGITTGNNNVVIGNAISGLSSSLSNNIIIADGQGNRRINVDSSGYVGIGTTTQSSRLTVAGDIFATGALRDSTNSAGTAGMVLQTTGSGTQWVATSSLGITGGGGATTFLALTDTPSSFTANRIMYTNSGATALVDSADFVFTGTNLGIGTSTPGSRLTIAGDAYLTGAFRDSTNASGTLGMVLQSTGTSTRWVATSTLGITGGGGGSLFTDAGATTYLTSTTDNLSIGTTTSSGLLTVDGTIAALDGIKFGGQRSVFIDSSSNMTFGEWALFYAENNANVYSNIGIGDNAGNNLRSGFSNVFMGFSAGANMATGSRSVVIGDHAVGNNPGVANIGAMVVIGDGAGQDLEDGANWQTLVGYRAGENITTGSGNTIFGYQAGNNITEGWENIVIGYDIDAPSASANNTLNIGNIIFGNSIDGTGTTVSTGNIGIGTSTPNAKLTVKGSGSNIFALYSSTATTTMLVESDGEVGFGATPNAQMTIFGKGQASAALTNSGNKGGILSLVDDNTSSGSGGAIVFGNSQSKSYGSLGHAAIKGLLVDGTNNTVGHLAFSTRNGTSDTSLTERMRIEYGGNVAIGTTTAAQKLQVWGNIRVGTSGTNGCLERFDGTALTGTCSSDEDLKTNINALATDDRSYLEGIAALNPVTYQWNEVAEDLYKRNTETTAIGLIAQEVEIIFPELVSIDDKGFRQVDLASLPFYIIQAIKEIWTKLTDQQEKIDELEERIQYLESLQSGGGSGGGGGSNPPPAPPVEEGGDTEGGGTGEVDSEGGNSEPIEIPPEEPAPDTEGGGTEVTEEPPAEDTSSAADDGGETESELPAEEGPAVTEEGG